MDDTILPDPNAAAVFVSELSLPVFDSDLLSTDPYFSGEPVQDDTFPSHTKFYNKSIEIENDVTEDGESHLIERHNTVTLTDINPDDEVNDTIVKEGGELRIRAGEDETSGKVVFNPGFKVELGASLFVETGVSDIDGPMDASFTHAEASEAMSFVFWFRSRTWNDLVKATFAAMNVPENIEYIDMPENLKGKYQYFTQADISKLRKAGYKKETTALEDAIKDYVQNYLQKNEYLGA